MPRINQTLDGYTLVRPVGVGALGQVWVCRKEETGEFKALRSILPQEEPERMEASLRWYRTTAATMKGLIPVEHIGRSPEGDLFFVMPLADGVDELSPDSPHWMPLSLTRQFQVQILLKEWFTAAQMKRLLVPVLEAVKRLHDAGMPYHEIYPGDILFVGGRPMLANFSFLSQEPPLASLLQSGSPEKSGFLNSGGTPTLWNVAAYLFAVLTGQPPEKLSRSKAQHPPEECTLRKEDLREWQRLHGVLHRILWAPPAKRMTHLREIIDAIDRTPAPSLRLPFRKVLLATAGAVACVAALGGMLRFLEARKEAPAPVRPETSEFVRLIRERDDALQQLAAAREEIVRLRAELEALRKQPAPPPPATARTTPDPATQKSHAELEAALNETRRQLYGLPSGKKPTPPPVDVGKTLQESLNKARLDTERKLQELEANPPPRQDDEALRNEARRRKFELEDPFAPQRPQLQGARLHPSEGL